MQEGWSRWKPTLILVGVTVVVVGLFVAFAGGRGDKPTIAASATVTESASPPASSAVATAPPPPTATASTVAATATAPPPPSTSETAPPTVGTLVPPGVPSGQGIDPPPNTITPDWQAQKSEQALIAVQARYDVLQKEIAELEKQGKTQEAQEKKVVLARLGKQIKDINAEIVQYKAEAAGSAKPDADTTK